MKEENFLACVTCWLISLASSDQRAYFNQVQIAMILLIPSSGALALLSSTSRLLIEVASISVKYMLPF